MTNYSKSLSITVKLNGNILKSLSLSPIRDMFIDFDMPVNIYPNKQENHSNLIRMYHNEYFVCIPKFFSGKVCLNNNLNSLDEIKNSKLGREFNNEIIIGIDTLDSLKINSNNFDISLSMTKNVVIGNKKSKNDLLPYVGSSTVASAMILGLIFSISPNANSLDLNSIDSSSLFSNATIKPDEEKEKDLSNLKNDIKNDPGGKGKKHKFDEGKMGKKESKNATGLYAIKGDVNNKDITLAREKALQTALDTSIIKYLSAGQNNSGSPFQSVFADKANGNNPEDILGGLYGNQIGEANGGYGLGLKGTGIGGGGDGEGTIGLGNDNTVGKGGGGGNGSNYGKGSGNLGGRTASAPDPFNGKAEIRGSLDKEIIRRVIKRNKDQIKYCYEAELQKDPSLSGRIVIKFVIGQNGNVVSSNAIGVGVSTIVDKCVAEKISHLSFPAPEGGGIVEVSYPFMFQSAGEQK